MRYVCLLSALLSLLFFPACDEQRPTNPRERAELDAIFQEARKLDDAGRFHEALVRYEAILSRRPDYMSTRLNAAMSAYDSGQYQKSADHFEVLHKYGPGDWFVIRKLVQCYERLGNDDKIRLYRGKLDRLRNQKDGSVVLKRYEGLTRDYIPIGTMHLIGYEFFEPQKHGRLWFFRLEDKTKAPVSAFMLEATSFHENEGKRIFCLTEATHEHLRVWHVGMEGRDYAWTRDLVLEILQGNREPLVTRPLPAEYQLLTMPEPIDPEKK